VDKIGKVLTLLDLVSKSKVKITQKGRHNRDLEDTLSTCRDFDFHEWSVLSEGVSVTARNTHAHLDVEASELLDYSLGNLIGVGCSQNRTSLSLVCKGLPSAELRPCDLAMSISSAGEALLKLHMDVGDLVCKGALVHVWDAVGSFKQLQALHMDLGVSSALDATEAERLQQQVKACGDVVPSLLSLAVFHLSCDGVQRVEIPPETTALVVDAWVAADCAPGRSDGLATVTLKFSGFSLEQSRDSCHMTCGIESHVPTSICKCASLFKRLHNVDIDITGLNSASCQILKQMSVIGLVENIKIRSPALEISKTEETNAMVMQFSDSAQFPSVFTDSVAWFSKVSVETLHLKLHGGAWREPPGKSGFKCCAAADSTPNGNPMIVNNIFQVNDLQNLVVDVGETAKLDFSQQWVARGLQQLENLRKFEIIVEDLASAQSQFKLAEAIQKAVGNSGTYVIRSRNGVRIPFDVQVALRRGPR